MIYVLAYPRFDPDTAGRIAAFRARHEPDRARLVAAHITLVFGVADRHGPVLSDLVDRVAEDTPAFPVVFDRTTVTFDPFEAAHKMFLVCADGAAQCAALHTRLYDGPHRAAFSTDHPFAPHVTIATNRAEAAVAGIDRSTIGALPLTGQVTALEMVRLEGGRLTTLKTAPLQG